MEELFDCSSDNIRLHLKNIYAKGELHAQPSINALCVVRSCITFTLFNALIARAGNDFILYGQQKSNDYIFYCL